MDNVVSRKEIELNVDKLKFIMGLKLPTDLRELRVFLDHVGYYRKSILRKYANEAMALTNLLRRDVDYVWDAHKQGDFELLKAKLASAPIMVPLDWGKKFHMYIDASTHCIRANLSQKDEEKRDHPIYYASRKMNDVEKKYIVTKREALAISFSCNNFRHFFLGYSTIFHINHNFLKSCLKYLKNPVDLFGPVARWVLLLQEFDFEILVRS